MKVILIDDEQLALHYLEYQLKNIADFQIIGMYKDPFDAKAAVGKNDVDIIFLDIHIPEMNGIELAEQLLEMKPSLNVVFVTAYDNYAIKAFELNALDYVMKPVSKERLLNTIQRIEQEVENISGVSSPSMAKLTLSLFQQVLISDGEQNRTPLRWRTTKVQQLFLYLLQRRGQVVEKSELIELLWPDSELNKAYSQLYTAIYHIRKTLAPFERYFQITNTSQGYVMTTEDVLLDVDEFERLIRSGQPLSEDTIDDYEHAISLYKGEYLQGYDYVWAESERQRLQSLWIRTSLKMAKWYYSNHHFDKATELCVDMCHRLPLEEESYFILMKTSAKMGNSLSVHHTYQRLQKMLQEELNEEPMPSITEWYKNWEEKNEE